MDIRSGSGTRRPASSTRTWPQYWKKHYDLRDILETNWTTLGPKLAHKINVYVGDVDSYFLNMGVHMLDEFLKQRRRTRRSPVRLCSSRWRRTAGARADRAVRQRWRRTSTSTRRRARTSRAGSTDEHPPPVSDQGAARFSGCDGGLQHCDAPNAPPPAPQTPAAAGAPPTFGTGPGAGPPVTAETFAEAEKLVQITMTPAERQQAGRLVALIAGAVPRAAHRAAESGARGHRCARDTLESAAAGHPAPPAIDRFVRSAATGAPLPSADDAIAFAPVTPLSRWIESRQLSSERLTQIYLSRIDRLDPKIRSVITVTRDHALARAKAADAEIAAGKYRGAAAWHSLRRERSARHQRHRDDLWRRALPQSRAGSGLRGGAPA